MEGPSFYCAYLNFTQVQKSTHNVANLQVPVKELYFKYRGSPQAGKSASVKVTLTGILIVLYEDGKVKAEIFFEFSRIVFVEAIKFQAVKGSSEKKPKALFVPLEERKGDSPSVSEKSAFSIEKNFHFLATTTHPPLVTCVVKRPPDGKVIDCHVFALDTIENALLFRDQILSQFEGGKIQMRSKNSPAIPRQLGADVIRTEYGEYSVYRGHQSYQPSPTQQRLPVDRIRPNSFNERASLSPGYDVEHTSPYVERRDNYGRDFQGQENLEVYSKVEKRSPSFNEKRRDASPIGAIPQGRQNTQGMASPGPYGRGGGGGTPGGISGGVPGGVILTQEDFSGPSPRPVSPYSPRDVGRRSFPDEMNYLSPSPMPHSPRMNDTRVYGEDRNPPSGNPPSSLNVPDTTGGYGMVQMRRVDVSESRRSRDVRSSSPIPRDHSPRVASPRPGSHSRPASQPVSPMTQRMVSPQTHNLPSPTSPLDPNGGGMFSASNLESRLSTGEVSEESHIPGKPVAKVPPHMKAGIKVLPSDFQAVKLKPKPVEKKPSESDKYHGDDVYDNDKEVLAKYRAMQEKGENNASRNDKSAHLSSSGNAYREYPESSRQRDREFVSAWDEAGGHPHMISSTGPKQNDADKRRGRGQGQVRGHMVTADEPNLQSKQGEIAQMFSGVLHFQPEQETSAGGRRSNNFEQGLGYLP